MASMWHKSCIHRKQSEYGKHNSWLVQQQQTGAGVHHWQGEGWGREEVWPTWAEGWGARDKENGPWAKRGRRGQWADCATAPSGRSWDPPNGNKDRLTKPKPTASPTTTSSWGRGEKWIQQTNLVDGLTRKCRPGRE
jgi:hypothetical protein